jgi:hypothetical protein
MLNLSSRVTILAIGADRSQSAGFRVLGGPRHDLDNLRNLLVENARTALFDQAHFHELYNPTSSELRQILNEYTIGRSADGDILIFYFSGHGVSIGRDDFGFCTRDTIVHTQTGVTLPLSVVKFSELLHSLSIVNVMPVIIIDACYSGIAGRTLNIPAVEAISSMQHEVHSKYASSYALLCSCTDNQTSVDTSFGGVFSRCLYELANEGLPREIANKPSRYLPQS